MTKLLGISALLFLCFAFVRPKKAYYLFLFLIPFTPRYLAIGIGESSLALTMKRLLVLILTGVFLLLVLIKPNIRASVIQAISYFKIYYILIYLLFIVKMLSTVVYGSVFNLFYLLDEILMVMIVLLYGAAYVKDTADVRTVVKCIVASLIISEIIAFIEFYIGHPPLYGIISPSVTFGEGVNPLEGLYRNEVYRTQAGFDNPLLLAEFICITSPLTLCLIQSNWKYLVYACLMLAPFSVLSTGSRSGVLIVVVSTMIFPFLVLYVRSGKWLRPLLKIVFIAMTTIVIWQVNQFIQRPQKAAETFEFLKAGEKGNISIVERANQYVVAKHAVSTSPVIGIGMKQNLIQEVRVLNRLDNYYIRILIESGIVGLLLYLALIYMLFKKLVELGVLSQSINSQRMFLSFTLSLASFAMYKMLVSIPYNNIYLYLILTCFFTFNNTSAKHEPAISEKA